MRPSARLARLLYRWRWPLTVLVLAGAVVCAGSANLNNINNDLSAWVAKDSPEYVEYERFRREFGGGRVLIIAVAGDGQLQRLVAGQRLRPALGRGPLTEDAERLGLPPGRGHS